MKMKIELTKETTDFIYQLAVVGAQANAQQVQTAVETFQKAALAASEAEQTGEPVVDELTEFVPVDGTA
jgi:hypothetical protein